MVYILRPKNPSVAYLESYAEANNNASDPNRNDPDYARSTPRHPTKRRNATSYTSGAVRSGIPDPPVDLNGKRRRSTRGRPSRKTEARAQNNEASGDEQSLSTSMENDTPSPVGPSTLLPYTTGDEGQNKETSEIGQRIGTEKSSFLGPPSPVGPGTLLLSTIGDEGHNKETSDMGQRHADSSPRFTLGASTLLLSTIGKEKSSFLLEDQDSQMKKTSKKTLEERLIPSKEKDLTFEGHNSSNERVSSSPEGTSSSQKTILSLLIDCKLIEEDEQVYYMDGTRESVAITGAITRVGILCSCCQEEISVWTFEKHADSNLKQPYEHICLPKRGTCLKDFLTTAWYDSTEQKRREPFDYTLKDQISSACLICGDGGDLFYCMNKGCHSAYHAFCMNMKRIPRGTWKCPYCLCKYCGLECQLQPIMCLQCHKIFHLECFNKFSKESKEISSRVYCSQSCQEICEKLKSSLAARTDLGEGNSWRVIQPVDMTSKLHLDRTLRLENNLKVAVSFKLMEESFKMKTYTGIGIDVVNGVLYSHRSDLKRINFSRFHTFILEKDDAVICAASVRIHGRMVAEMPFIATDEIFRGQGFCSKLMKAIESYLQDLKVQNLIIPAVPETCEMWKLKYGFKELTAELRKYVSSYNILMFPNAIKLYKSLSSLVEGPEPDKVKNEKQTENHNTKEIQDKNTKKTLLDLDMEGPEFGKVNNEKQTEDHNAKDIQDKNTRRTSLDLDMEGPEPGIGKVNNEKQTEDHNAKDIQDKNTRTSLDLDMEGPELGKVNNEKQTEDHNAKDIQDKNTRRTSLDLDMEGPEPGKVNNEKQTEDHNAKDIQDKNTRRRSLDLDMEGPELGKVNNEKQTENHNAKEIQDKNTRRTLLDLNMEPSEED